ncbi:protein-glutamate methylesterase/protein-glutamine glutaminase [Paraclostridium sordellii]|uniref:protein-glutamate methylesterase/protein-glutamine glutaminase n=1 Tax=Paraclostridium sordellii TaxID=1505 RepID=UPI0005E7A631|nr:chemotaxis response regulator protein-glutamate methylesterase [Paeniclostridium sordellii]CEN21403.1 response regulator receiver modulated CheB methylesterase [[Clostridium] sordellii] [Paeniclostridium sordellii]CEP88359.1 response regulator receiver modulated CheB methylesterase [[Clostridium] sordellii] [Paeniclostridium sordellii]CEP97019.1 response regulator receiver modulated CheB methylesterase [[Clostridium] sordellii] [Paeniclostridium sordellii]CEQ00707.1 response regulator receiv
MEINKKIKVLVVDDSSMFRRIIKNYLQENPDLEVVDTAKDPYEARDKILELRPDVLTLDIEMPGMNGIDFLKILMDQCPIPTIVISGVDGRCFEAISAGAVGFVEKPTANTMKDFSIDLASKIREASVAKLEKSITKTTTSKIINKVNVLKNTGIRKNNSKEIIAIGASMGGVEAVGKLLKQLPLGLPGIVITQHMPPVFTKRYAERLNRECLISVSEGKDGEEVLSGHAYIAPGGFQMGIIKKNNKYVLEIIEGEKVSGHCPSVDYLFQSIAKVAKDNSIGVILTGMGSDGAKGLLDIRESGGYTIGQNKNSCVVYGMPMAAKNIGAVAKETSLAMIPNAILNQLKRRQSTVKSNDLDRK